VVTAASRVALVGAPGVQSIQFVLALCLILIGQQFISCSVKYQSNHQLCELVSPGACMQCAVPLLVLPCSRPAHGVRARPSPSLCCAVRSFSLSVTNKFPVELLVQTQ
jgi:hypothetical protein